ncbi:MAG: hypothetical protein ACTSRI_19775 [Promethearchaeota archaeon]
MREKKQNFQDWIKKQKPKYSCYLDPYSDYDFSHCPKCNSEIKIKDKLFYLVINVEPGLIVTINLDCRFCPYCNLIIVKKRELESFLIYACEHHNFAKFIGNDYSVIGLTDKKFWKSSLEKVGNSRKLRGHFNPLYPCYI